jgi:phosphoglycolate phosphatase
MSDSHAIARPRLAVFDMDGTLVDSQHMITAAMAKAFAAEGLPAPLMAVVRRVVGLSLGAAIAGLLPDVDSGQLARLEDNYKAAFFTLREAGEDGEAPFEGIEETLDAFRHAGWILGIATGKSTRGMHATLERFGLAGRFKTLQTADTSPGKPAPDMLHRAMEEAGAEAAATVMIGDTSFDMEMARAAKVAGIGVGWGYHEESELLAAGAHCVIGDLAGLLDAAEAVLAGRPAGGSGQ